MTMAEQRLKDEWEEQRAAHACDLFPKEYDFLGVCSCLECQQKIKMLKEFEEEMKSRRIQLKESLVRLQAMRTHCVELSTVLEWTRKTFDLLHKVLERNSEALLTPEESNLAADLKERDLEIVRLLLTNCVLDSFADESDDLKYDISVADQIDRGLFFYKQTKAWGDAYPHLKKMQDIERDMVKKSVEEDHKQLDHLFFQKCIKEQIECIKLLPIKEVQREVEEVVAKFFPVIECKDKEREDMDSILRNLMIDIQDTCLHMIRIRKKFWQKCRKSPTLTLKRKRKLKMHSLTGLKRTLESLEWLACSFNDKWKHYAPLFTPFYEIGVKKATN